MLEIPILTDMDKVRFWSKVIMLPNNQCWNWTGGCTGNTESRRRPIFKIKFTNYIAARIAWVIKHDYDPGEYLVCHSCIPKPGARQLCVNPNHLWLGTYGENRADALRTGQATSNRSRLKDHDVLKIRERYASGESATKIGEDYSLHRRTIWAIGTQKHFSNVT